MSRQDYRTTHEKSWDWVHPVLRKYFTALYGYVDTSPNQNYIGAEAAAFSKQMLPLLEWKGPGEVVDRQLICTAPQVYVTQQVVPTGIAGIAAGQIWNGGLVDNPNTNSNLSGEIV
ncbi:MAG: hypothetical protein KGJ13_06295 [Patescibacteria group bacterium]|nr:hypothetical protein [Patescibacteria group bacterium]